MRRVGKLSLALLALGAVPIAPVAGQTASVVLQGTVADSIRAFALGGVSIELRAPTVITATQTDADGRFRLVATKDLRYTLVVRRIGYTDRVIDGLLLTKDTTVALRLIRLPQALASMVVRDSVTGIGGVVGTAIRLQPIHSARVQVGGIKNVVSTDSAGRFFLPLESPGTYIVRITRDGYAQSFHSVRVNRKQVADASVLLDSGPAKRSPALDADWDDLDQRQRWRGMNSAFVSGAELSERGGMLSDALRTSPSFTRRGLLIGPSTCVFLDGVPRPGLPLDAVRPEKVEAIELYGPNGEGFGGLELRWPRGYPCADAYRLKSPTGLWPKGVARFAVIWTKR